MNWKRVISGVLAAAMLSALPVQLLVSAEGTEAVGQADGWEELTTLESLDESNTFFYSKDDQTFEKITHPEKDVKTADGIVDYLGVVLRGGRVGLAAGRAAHQSKQAQTGKQGSNDTFHK